MGLMRCLLLLSFCCGSLFAQRTPLKVNGAVINNPNLTNSSSLTWSSSGQNISGTALDLWTNKSGTLEPASDTLPAAIRTLLSIGNFGAYITSTNSTMRVEAPVKISANVFGAGEPTLELNTTNAASGHVELLMSIQGTNVLALDQNLLNGGPTTVWFLNTKDPNGAFNPQMFGDSRGDLVFGFNVLMIAAATNGFLFIPSISDIPTGRPYYFDSFHTPLAFDRTSNRLWAYDTNWFDTSGQVLNYSSTAATSQYLLLKPASATTASITGAADTPFGIAMNATSGASQSVQVMTLNGSVFNMVATNTVTLGTLLEPGPNGTCRTLSGTAGTHIIVGMALETKTNATVKVKTDLFLRDI